MTKDDYSRLFVEAQLFEKETSFAHMGVAQKCWQEAIGAGKGRLGPLPAGINLDLVFSLQYERIVRKDGTFSFNGKRYKLRHLSNTKVKVGIVPNQKMLVIKDVKRFAEYPL